MRSRRSPTSGYDVAGTHCIVVIGVPILMVQVSGRGDVPLLFRAHSAHDVDRGTLVIGEVLLRECVVLVHTSQIARLVRPGDS